MSVARASNGAWSRGTTFRLEGLRVLGELEEVCTFHAIPVTVGNMIETDAVGVVCSIAAIAEQKYIFSFGRIADWARVGIFLFLFGVVP